MGVRALKRSHGVPALVGVLILCGSGCEAIVTESDWLEGGQQGGEASVVGDAGAVGDASVHTDGGSNTLPGVDANGHTSLDGGQSLPGSDAGNSATDGGATTPVDASTMTMAEPEGRMNGIVAAHNRVRAAVSTTPALAPLTWSADIAAFAQEWADKLALTCKITHRTNDMLQPKDYGENIATFGISGGSGLPSNAQKAVDGWAAEKTCWTYGTLSGLGVTGTERCDTACYTKLSSDGCGHYTAIVARRSTQLGCGVSTCKSGSNTFDIWVCNYSPAGNFVGRAPY